MTHRRRRGCHFVSGLVASGLLGFSLIAILPSPAVGSRHHWDFPLSAGSVSDVTAPFSLEVTTGQVHRGHVHRGRGHRGIDVPATVGDEILAVGDGTVYFSGVIAGKPTISIDHGDLLKVAGLRVRSTYEPVHSLLTRGERVRRGQVIGTIAFGQSHCNAICLHLGLKVDRENYVDPALLWLDPPSLLPSARG